MVAPGSVTCNVVLRRFGSNAQRGRRGCARLVTPSLSTSLYFFAPLEDIGVVHLPHHGGLEHRIYVLFESTGSYICLVMLTCDTPITHNDNAGLDAIGAQLGWRVAMVLPGVMGIAYGALLIVSIEDGPDDGSDAAAAKKKDDDAKPATKKAPKKAGFDVYVQVMKNPAMWGTTDFLPPSLPHTLSLPPSLPPPPPSPSLALTRTQTHHTYIYIHCGFAGFARFLFCVKANTAAPNIFPLLSCMRI